MITAYTASASSACPDTLIRHIKGPGATLLGGDYPSQAPPLRVAGRLLLAVVIKGYVRPHAVVAVEPVLIHLGDVVLFGLQRQGRHGTSLPCGCWRKGWRQSRSGLRLWTGVRLRSVTSAERVHTGGGEAHRDGLQVMVEVLRVHLLLLQLDRLQLQRVNHHVLDVLAAALVALERHDGVGVGDVDHAVRRLDHCRVAVLRVACPSLRGCNVQPKRLYVAMHAVTIKLIHICM